MDISVNIIPSHDKIFLSILDNKWKYNIKLCTIFVQFIIVLARWEKFIGTLRDALLSKKGKFTILKFKPSLFIILFCKCYQEKHGDVYTKNDIPVSE